MRFQELLSRGRTRKLIIVGLDLLITAVSLWAAYSVLLEVGVDFSPTIGPADTEFWRDRLIPLLAVAALMFVWRRLYAIHPRYMGLYDLLNISFVAGIIALAGRLNEQVLNPSFSISSGWAFPLLGAFLAGSLLCAWRLVRRVQALRLLHSHSRLRRTRRILIVGVHDAGEAVYRELVRDPRHDTVVAGYICDDKDMVKSTVHGLPVLGTPEDIPAIVARESVTEVLITSSNMEPSDLRRVFDYCSNTTARIRILPSFPAMVEGQQDLVPLIRDIDVNDLLRRDSVRPDKSASEKYISGERVLITGGGGSIGSELARQVAALSPASLVLLGKGEGSIFETEQELSQVSRLRPVPVICDVRDKKSIEAIFKVQYPSVVFHAAAHKHVPLMEHVPIEAIRNNIFGTLNAADAAIKTGAKKFILVSTDKAVRPSNVMGATKRVAEMIVQALAQQSETSFSAVRFGNVLGSRGSLVPLIKKQIQRGGPITITHPEMTRYFMTIPEAAELILQAGAQGGNGEVFVLDMGKPVKIVELIKDIIRMHGLVPSQDIELKYIGIRPGEKIHEELYFEEEDVLSSGHPKIHLVANPVPIRWEWLKGQLEALHQICDSGDQEAARTALMELAWAKNLPPVNVQHAAY